jgi:hypothetical protein
VSPFEVVAVVITIFFGFGIAMGVLFVMALPRRRGPRYLDGRKSEEPPPSRREDHENRPPWYDR